MIYNVISNYINKTDISKNNFMVIISSDLVFLYLLIEPMIEDPIY